MQARGSNTIWGFVLVQFHFGQDLEKNGGRGVESSKYQHQWSLQGMRVLAGNLYYATDTTIGYYDMVNTWTDSWKTSANGVLSGEHSMTVQNLSLFIANSYYVAAVDNAGAFSANVLDLQTHHSITDLVPYEDYLLIGTAIGSNVNQAGLFLWDTYSSSWTLSDTIDDAGVNMFIRGDNITYIQAGTTGNLYYWNGSKAQKYKKLRDGSNTITTTLLPYGVNSLGGLALISNGRGVYSLGTLDAGLNPSLAIEYVPSAGQGVTPGAILTVGTQMLMAWQSGSNYGVDKLDTNRYSGTIATPIALGKYTDVRVGLDSLPASTSVGIETSIDGAAYASQTVVTDSTDERVVRLKYGVKNKRSIQARVTLTGSTTSTPVINSIDIV